MARVVNEGSTSYHQLGIAGKDGEVVSPESMRYRLMDGKKAVLIDWTEISATATEIEIAAEHNIIATNGNKRILTIEVTHNGGKKITGELVYGLGNLGGI